MGDNEGNQQPAEQPKGKVVASFDVHVTLRDSHEMSIEEWLKRPGATDPIPTIEKLEDTIRDGLYDGLRYFHAEEIHVSATRTDR